MVWTRTAATRCEASSSFSPTRASRLCHGLLFPPCAPASVQAGDGAEPAPAPAVLVSAGLHPAALSRAGLQSRAGM